MPERTNRDPAPGFVAFDTLLAEALREQTRRELAALPGPRQLAQLYPDTSAWDKRLKKALAARRRAAARAARAARKTAPPPAAAPPGGHCGRVCAAHGGHAGRQRRSAVRRAPRPAAVGRRRAAPDL